LSAGGLVNDTGLVVKFKTFEVQTKNKVHKVQTSQLWSAKM